MEAIDLLVAYLAQVFKAHILLHHSPLGLSVIKKKKKKSISPRSGPSRPGETVLARN